MRLDNGGAATTAGELLDRFAGRRWVDHLASMNEFWLRKADAAGTVRWYEGGLTSSEAIETGDGPYVVVVDGDLLTPGHADLETLGGIPARVIVTGSLHAGSLSFGGGGRVVVEGAAGIERVCAGMRSDCDGVFDVGGTAKPGSWIGGELSVPLLALDWRSGIGAAGGFRGLICAQHPVGGVGPDIKDSGCTDGRFFPSELLGFDGGLHLGKLIEAGRTGAPLLRPGVAESFPDRLRLRKMSVGI
jgi:hypothetical protein